MKNIKQCGPMPKLWIGTRVEKEGVILEDRYEEGHSWTRNGWWLMNGTMLDCVTNNTGNEAERAAVTTSGTLVVGVNIYRNNIYANQGLQNNATNDAFGIVIGSGTGIFHPYRHNVDVKINHGSGAGQMSYAAQTNPVVSFDSSTKKHKAAYERVFNNNSSGSISVGNVGLVWSGYMFGSSQFLISYDLLSSPITVPVGAQLTITYEIETEAQAWHSQFPHPSTLLGVQAIGGTIVQVNWNETLLVVSPKTGGEGENLNFSNPTISTNLTGTSASNTATLIASGTSEIGNFCAAANAANLGGYNNWIIPNSSDLNTLHVQRSLLGAGEGYADASYWTSERNSSSAFFRNLHTGASGSGTQSVQRYVRLMRWGTFTEYYTSL